MSVFDNMSDEEIKLAQDRLRKLCKENNIRPFSITAKKAPWKKLVLHLCGIGTAPPKDPGAKRRDQEHIDDFLQFIMCFAEFGDASGNYKKLTMQDFYEDYLKNQSNHFKRPFETTKSLENVFYKEFEDFMKRLNERFKNMESFE